MGLVMQDNHSITRLLNEGLSVQERILYSDPTERRLREEASRRANQNMARAAGDMSPPEVVNDKLLRELDEIIRQAQAPTVQSSSA